MTLKTNGVITNQGIKDPRTHPTPLDHRPVERPNPNQGARHEAEV